MQTQVFEHAQDFIWRNARLIDRRLFEYLFHQGRREEVVAAVRAYQNPDGGFGNAIEPDNRAPDSQPIAVEMALRYLFVANAITDAQVQSELLLPLCAWLQTVTTPAGGVPFVLPTANAYAHTPWMGTQDDHPPAELNPTASIAGYLFAAGIQHPWLEQAADFCWRQIESSDINEYHAMITELIFLQNVPDRARAEPCLARLVERAGRSGMVEFDPNAGGYVHMPLDWAGQPSSPFRALFSTDILVSHLNHLAARQRPDGGWPISWDAVSLGAEMEWRAKMTVDALITLQSYETAGISAG